MIERRLSWCDYEVVDGLHGRYIQENGTWQGRGSARVLAERGVEFPHKGKDAALWLLREGEPELLAVRRNGVVGQGGFIVSSDERCRPDVEFGIRIEATAEFLQAGDGFVVLPIDTKCIPGPIDTEEDRPRPTCITEAEE